MKSTYLFPAFALCTLLLFSCGGKTAAPAEEHVHEDENTVEITAEQFRTADIRLGGIEEKALSGTVKVNGMLDVPPQNLVSVSSPFGGFVKSTEMLQGMKIKKGQVVATLQHPDFIQFQQDYLDYKSQLDYLQLEYERQQELASENVNSQKALQKARSEYRSMQAKVMGLAAKLELMNIGTGSLEKGSLQSTITLYSPINGYVTQVNTNIGEYAAPTDVLFRIADTEHLHAELTVFEKDVPKIKPGQKVRFTLSNETRERMATVYLVGKEISNERTVQVHCHLDTEDTELLPGMYLKAWVESGSNRVPALPENAVVAFRGRKYIFAEQENTHGTDGGFHFEMVEIQTGVTELGYTEIIFPEGFKKESRKIVVNGAYDLLGQMKNGEEGDTHTH